MTTIHLHGYEFELDDNDLVPLTEIWKRAGSPKGKEPYRFKAHARTRRWVDINNPCRVPWKGVRGKGTWVGQSLLVTWYIEWLGLEYKPASTRPETERDRAEEAAWKAAFDAKWEKDMAERRERARERMAKKQAEEAARKPADPESESEPEPPQRRPENGYGMGPEVDSEDAWVYEGESWQGEYNPYTAGEGWQAGYDDDTAGEGWKGEPEPAEPPYFAPGTIFVKDRYGRGPDDLFMTFLDAYEFVRIRASVN